MSIFRKPVEPNSVFPNNTVLGDNPLRYGVTETIITPSGGVGGRLQTVYFSQNLIMLRLFLEGEAVSDWTRVVGIAPPYMVPDFDFAESRGFIEALFSDNGDMLVEHVGAVRVDDGTADCKITFKEGATFTDTLPRAYFLWLNKNPSE